MTSESLAAGAVPEVMLPGGAEAIVCATFEPKSYVQTLRRSFSLEQLSIVLEQELSKVKVALVNVVNDRRRDVVKLCLDLQSATQLLPSLRSELLKYMGQTSELSRQANAITQALTELLTTHKQQLCLKASEDVMLFIYETVKTDLLHMHTLQSEEPRGCLLLELIAGDIASSEKMLKRLPSFSQSNMHDRGLDPVHDTPSETHPLASALATVNTAVTELRQKCLEWLEHYLSHTVAALWDASERSAEEETQLLLLFPHLYSGLRSLNEEKRGKDTIRRYLVTPVIDKATQEALSQNTDSRSPHSEADAFIAMLEKQMERRWRFFFDLLQLGKPENHSNQPLGEPTLAQCETDSCRFEGVIEECFIHPIMEALTQHFRCFVPIFPEAFLQNFIRIHRFIETLLSFVTPSQNRLVFLRGDSWRNFTALFRTQAYEASRGSAIVQTFESHTTNLSFVACLTPLPTSSNTAFVPYCLEISHALEKALLHCIDTSSIIERELPRVLRLAAELVFLHYIPTLHRLLSQCGKEQSGALAQAEEQKQHLLGNILHDVLSFQHQFRRNPSEPLPASRPNNQSRLGIHIQSLTQMVISQPSAFLPVALLDAPPSSCLKAGTPPSALDYRQQLLTEYFHSLAKELDSERQYFIERLIESFIKNADLALLAMRGIPALYRMTNRQITGDISRYVGHVNAIITRASTIMQTLTPLWQSETKLQQVKPSTDTPFELQNWFLLLLEKYFHLFGTRLKDAIDAVQAQEQSLIRLQKLRAGGNSPTPHAQQERKQATSTELPRQTDTQKIILQLKLDADNFCTHCTDTLKTMDTDTQQTLQDLPGFQHFKKIVSQHLP